MRRILCCKNSIKFFIVIALVLSLTQGVYAVPSSLTQQKKDAESGLNSANKKVDKIEGEREEAQEEVEEIDSQLVELLAQVEILEDEIANKKVQVEVAKQEHDAAKAEEEKQYEAMKARIKFMYEQGESNYVDLILQSKSFSDAVNKADYVEKLYDYDRQLLEDYQQTKLVAKQKYEQLVEEEAQLEGMQVEFKEQQTELESVLSEKKAVVENFDSKLAAAKKEAKNYEAKVKEVNSQIAKQAAAEKAAREKAERERKEREAKAKAEADAKAKADAQAAGEAAGNGEAAGKPSNDTDTDASQVGELEKPSNSGGGSAVSGSGTGADIASFACKFIGNPYVSGGTSLTNGTDCSGFTMSVYSHFGYKIPRTSSQQAGYGKSVSYSEAKAGDIMCYAGHVGIYLGNGMIVHASTPASGIKTSIATYRPILSIRRIVN